MNKLRALHLYLGCVFAPMLLFFAFSGIVQTFGWHLDPGILQRLSTIHTARGLKNGGELTSPALRWFALAMAFCFILTILLGVLMALKHGKNRKAAYACLALGVIVPAALVLTRL